MIDQQKNMLNINLCRNQVIPWSIITINSFTIQAKGFSFYNNKLYNNNNLASLLINLVQDTDVSELQDHIQKILLELNGNFAIVIYRDDWLFAAVDRVRSIPLFYGQKDNEFYLSDDAEWVRQQVGDTEMDDLSMKEFMLTGYVTGQDTLYPDVKQLQAGECLSVNSKDDNIELITNRYYQWIHGDYSEATEEELCEEMDHMHLRVFERLLESTKGRTLVIPLSGGYDSRLIVTMLKRLGRENVICFSYGRPGNWESEISKKVAEQLGYQWLFIPYSRKSWYQWYHCEEMESYLKYGSGLTSIAHIQDWPAVWEMKKQNLIPTDSVFVPGHSGDFTAGSHIPTHWNENSKLEIHDLYQSMIKKHYNLWDIKYEHFISLLERKFYSIISQFTLNSSTDFANAFEYWDWQERQAKFIINSVRVYEFWGYDWRIPLWDNEMLDYWSKIQLSMRLNRTLYLRMVNNEENQTINSSLIILEKNIKEVIYAIAKSKYFLGIPKRLKLVIDYNTHPLAFFGINNYLNHVLFCLKPNNKVSNGFTINSLIAQDMIRKLDVENPLEWLEEVSDDEYKNNET